MGRFRFMNSLQGRILIGMVGALVIAVGGMSYLLRIYYNDRMVRNLEGYALYLSQTVEDAFEFATSVHSMEGIREGIGRLDRHKGVRRIMLVNRDRKVAMASSEEDVGRSIEFDEPTCRVCHHQPVGDRSRAAVVSVDDQQILRVAVPIRNEPRCQGCHNPDRKVEGMVVLDYALDKVKGSLFPGVVGTTSLFILVTVGLVFAIGLLMNRLVVRRLSHLDDIARSRI